MTALLLVLTALAPQVRTGLDRLAEEGFAPLKGRRIGLVVNATSRDRAGRHLIELAAAAKDVRLAALFSPEHGLRGAADTEVADGRDEATGLPVHSLYGKHRKPTAEMLAGVDLLVFDIQDVGTRYYTYITTLALVMEAAKEHGKQVMVLDRPNPIGGEAVEGPLQDETLLKQFISYFYLPVRHGMTIGELARLFNADYGIGCELTVVPMEGWTRGMWYDETGLPWINPSPNMRSLAAATAYPGLGALEGTSLSVGRGTGRAFELYGAPWVDAGRLCRELNARGLEGVSFKEAAFTPRLEPGFPRYPHTDAECRGFELKILDRKAFRPVSAALHVLDVLHRLHPKEFTFKRACAMIGQPSLEDDLKAGRSPGEIEFEWKFSVQDFRRRRQPRLLYP
ncbi:MAG TPA: DUF1343 domain-containing protein [Planctomycetota bacterium]|nr:DUF1343 domain-containing protein [Planctomycetota bacterium]